MIATLLGTGTPTHPSRFQTAVLVEIGAERLLFDCGRGAVHQMYQAGVDLKQVNPLFITHHHFDHINDLYDVMVSTAMRGRKTALDIYGPTGTSGIVRALIDQVYAADIRFRIEEDREIRAIGGQWEDEPRSIADVRVRDIQPGLVMETERWKVYADEVLHGRFSDAPDFDWHCLGYRIESEDKVLTISGDSVPCAGLSRLAQDADVLIQCCHLPRGAVNDIAMEYLTDSILPHSGQVGAIAAGAGVKRMVLTHLSPAITPDVLEDVAHDFGGDVQLGHDLMRIEI